MFISMAVDFWRSRALGKIAAKYDSHALEADALHFSTDIWSSGIVVLGLVLVLLGRIWNIVWLRDADPVAALFVAGVVVYVSWRLARRTIDALLDAAPAGVRNKIIAAAWFSRVDGATGSGPSADQTRRVIAISPTCRWGWPGTLLFSVPRQWQPR